MSLSRARGQCHRGSDHDYTTIRETLGSCILRSSPFSLERASLAWNEPVSGGEQHAYRVNSPSKPAKGRRCAGSENGLGAEAWLEEGSGQVSVTAGPLCGCSRRWSLCCDGSLVARPPVGLVGGERSAVRERTACSCTHLGRWGSRGRTSLARAPVGLRPSRSFCPKNTGC